ncbi:MAG: carboxypeptidase regulatory-like domain-containing protein [Vicinamibacterales bacterium]
MPLHTLVTRSLACCLLALAASSAAAQTNAGQITGVVKDSSGAVLPGATVTATHPASGTTVERVSDATGRFLLPELRVGEWNIDASLSGFRTSTAKAVTVEIGRILQIDFTLGLEGLTETVTVAATVAPLVQATNAEISDVITNREVVQIPINGRNLMALAQLSDAVVIPPGGTRGESLQQAGPLPNVGGQRSGHNIYLLDGAKVTDELFNNLVINPSIDSVQEFKIQKSQYPAEFGGKASALINVATKAGANRFTGSLFEFFRDDAFDATNYFLPKGQKNPPLRQNQFGGAFGGPIVQNRTFFFGSYEGQRLNRTQTRTFSVPSAALRTGDFSGLGAVCDPTPSGCVPFPGNQIPASRIDPVAAAMLRAVPMPTGAGNVQNLSAAEELEKQVNQMSLRVDHRLTDSDQLFARFSTFSADETQPFGTSVLSESIVPGFGRTLDTRTKNLVASHTRVLGNSMLNEVRFGWMTVTGGQRSVNAGADFARQTGLLGVTTDRRDMGFPQISTGGLFNTFGDPTSFVARNNQHFELYENFSIARAKHNLKFGAYYFHLQLRPEQPDNARGAFTYTGQFSGNALADFLLGYPVAATSGIGRGDEDGRTNWIHLYAQDDWRLRDNLTVNVGLRYEFNQHMYDANNRLSSIDIDGKRFVIASDDDGNINPAAQPLLPLIPIPYTTSKDAGWGPGLMDPSAVRLAPRTGFALSLQDGKTVVRGGYGIFLNQWAYSVQTAFARNLPFFYTKQVNVPIDVRVPTLQTRDILTGNATGTVGGTIMDYAYSVEYSQTWSGGVQRELGHNMVADVFYMGTWTLGADNATVHNVPEPGPGAIQPRRPIPQLSNISAIRFDGKSIYHGVTVKTEKRMSDGFAFNVAYTWSHSKDDASSPGPTESETNFPQNVRNIFSDSGEWALSSFNRTHQFVASGTLMTPGVGSGLSAALTRDWRFNTIVTAQSGAPFTVNLSIDRANIGAGPAQRPNQSGDPNLPGDQRTPDRWFDTSVFTLPDAFTFGNAPRNSVVGPGFANVDFSVARTFPLGDGPQVEFRWEIFNLLNRANFDLPNRTFGNANFGRIFSARDPRQMQFGLRFSF